MTIGVRPWAALAGLCAGIVAPHARLVPFAVALALAAIARRRRQWARVLGVALLGFACGVVISVVRFPDDSALAQIARRVPRCEVRATVLEHLGGFGTLASINWARCGGAVLTRAGNVVIDDMSAEPGASLVGGAWLLPLSDGGFDAARRHSGALARLDPIDVTVRGPRSVPHRIAARYRAGLREAVLDLDARRSALLLGLTIGETGGMDGVTTENFRRAGLSHLVAVSGSNVAIVIGTVLVIGMRWSFRMRLLSASAALIMFVLIVGPDPSVLRAAVMAGIMLLALREGVSVHPLRALGLALIILVALRPGLVTSVGLHLSAAATAGIVVLGPAIARRLARLPRVAALAVGATLGAQLAVLPLLIAYFEQVSLAAPVANLVAMPAVGPATVLGLLGGAAATGWPALGEIAARAAEPFVAVILWSADTFGAAPLASVRAPAVSGWFVAAAVLLLGTRINATPRLT